MVALANLRTRLPVYLDAPDVIGAFPEQLRGLYGRFVPMYERWVARSAARTFVCSEVDRRRFLALGVPADRLEIVPNGVDTTEFRPDDAARGRVRRELAVEDRNVTLFFGQLGYCANLEGLALFVERVLPKLDARTCLVVVGRGLDPDEATRLSALPNVIVTGEVDRISDYVNAVDVSIVPLLHGTGTRLKILESLACGMPVLSTTAGAEGLELEELGAHAVVEDDWSRWPKLITELGTLPRQPASPRFVQTYDWRAIFDRLTLPREQR